MNEPLPEVDLPPGYTVFSDKTLWGWCQAIAHLARVRPDDHVDQIADEVMAELWVVKAEKGEL